MDEESIFDTARRLPTAEEQDKYLHKTCGDDLELLARVRELLSIDANSQQILDRRPPGLKETGEVSRESLEAGLAPTFATDAALVIGNPNHSVLQSLSRKLDAVPNVTLKEAADGRIEKPGSAEIPADKDGKIQLHGEIARGGMGAVIKGRDVDLGRDLAVKVLLDQHSNSPGHIERFVEEAQIGGQLQHPGIAPVYSLGQFEDRPYFTMKLVKGETLAAILAKRRSPQDEVPKLLGVFEQICQTMAYAHSKGVIHRDLKPANIMIGAFGEVQVMDWGLSKVLKVGGVADEKKTRDRNVSIVETKRSEGSDGLGSDTLDGSVMGTPAYMPPEQAHGETDRLDPRTDVFGLGAILAEILTGDPPYKADDNRDLLRLARRAQLDDCFERLDAVQADDELVTICKRALSVEQNDRYHDASELADAVTAHLEGVQEQLKQTELARVEAEMRALEEGRRKRLYLGITGIVGVALLGVGSLALLLKQSWDNEKHANLDLKNANDALVAARDKAISAQRVAEESQRREERERTRADLTLLVEKAKALRAQYKPITGILLLVEALEISRRKGLWPFPEAHEALLEATMEISGSPIPDSTLSSLSLRKNRRVELNEDRLRVWNLSEDASQPSVDYQLESPYQFATNSAGSRWINDDATAILVSTIDGTHLVRLNEEATQVDEYVKLTTANESVSLSPDGSMFAYILGEQGYLRTKLLDESSEVVLGKLSMSGLPVFSPDNRWAAKFVHDGVFLWDLDADDIAASLRSTSVDHESSEVLCFSPDGRWMKAGATLFDLNGDEPLEAAYPITANGRSASFSPNGKMLALGLSGQVQLYELGPSKPEIKAILRTKEVSQVCFSPDGRWLATSDPRPYVLRLFDIEALPNEAGKTEVMPSGERVKVWDPFTWGLYAESSSIRYFCGGSNNHYRSIEFSSNGRYLKAESYHNTKKRLWDLKSPHKSESILPIPENPKCIAYSPDGCWLAAGCDQGITKIFRVEDGLPTGEFANIQSGHPGFSFVTFSKSGSHLLSLSQDFQSGPTAIEVWNPSDTGEPVARLTGFDVPMYRAVISDDQRFVVAYAAPWEEAASDVYCWDLRGRHDDPRILSGHDKVVWNVQFDDQSTRVYSAGRDGKILSWNLEEAQPEAKELFSVPEEVLRLNRLEDGWRIVTVNGGDPRVRLSQLDARFNVLSSGEVQLDYPRKYPRGNRLLKLSPNGDFFTGVRAIWDVTQTPELVATHGHEGLYANAISPDSRFYAAISHRVPASIWLTQLATGHTMQLDNLMGRRSRSDLSTTFSPDSRWLATATHDIAKEIRFWDMDVDRLIERAKRLAGRELRRTERLEFNID